MHGGDQCRRRHGRCGCSDAALQGAGAPSRGAPPVRRRPNPSRHRHVLLQRPQRSPPRRTHRLLRAMRAARRPTAPHPSRSRRRRAPPHHGRRPRPTHQPNPTPPTLPTTLSPTHHAQPTVRSRPKLGEHLRNGCETAANPLPCVRTGLFVRTTPRKPLRL